MPLKSLTCPSCEGRPMMFVAEVETGEFHPMSSIDLVCFAGNQQGCGEGASFDTDESPVDIVQQLIKIYFPMKGIHINVEPEEENSSILSFDYKDNNYGECKTIFSCSMPDPDSSDYRISWYLVEFPRGKALLQQRKSISIEPEPDKWLLMDIDIDIDKDIIFGPEDENGLQPAIRKKSRAKAFLFAEPIASASYAISGYRALYEIEKNVRELIIKRFPENELDKMLKTISIVTKDNKHEDLYESISRRKSLEQARELSSKGNPFVEYIEWGEYIEIFRKKWDTFSNKKFAHKEEAKKSFISKIEGAQWVRHKIAHMRSGITKNDIDLLKAAREAIRKLLN